MTKRILDEETKKLLQGYVPFSCDAIYHHTPDLFTKSNIPKELHPVFNLRCLKQSELTQLKANHAALIKDDTDSMLESISESNNQIYRKCVTGWKNLFDAGTGELIEAKTDTDGSISKDLWCTLPIWIVNDLSIVIRRISGVSTVEQLSLK